MRKSTKKATSPEITLPRNFYTCERGNIWLSDEDGDHIAWFRFGIGNDQWLKVSVVPGNFPGFQIATVIFTEKQLAAHIRSQCAGWRVNRLNIEGVKIEDDCVVGDDA
jgi:hypothetical protein